MVVNNTDGFWDSHGYTDVNKEAATDENEVKYPQGFAWSCCGRVGTSKGCKLRQHRCSESMRAASSAGPPRSTARKDKGDSASEASVCDTESEVEP